MTEFSSSSEQKKDHIAALLREREGRVVAGDTDSVAAIDAELKRLGVKASTGAQRAAKR